MLRARCIRRNTVVEVVWFERHGAGAKSAGSDPPVTEAKSGSPAGARREPLRLLCGKVIRRKTPDN